MDEDSKLKVDVLHLYHDSPLLTSAKYDFNLDFLVPLSSPFVSC